ncbi:MAG: HlyD family efflux transporter periplasmic adaptor subunit [Patescibacteria group bacterium]
MQSLINFLRRTALRTRAFSVASWRRYRGLKKWQQIALAILLAVLLIAGITLLRQDGAHDAGNQLRTVTLATVGELSGQGDSVSILGTVRSITEADVLAQSGGTVRSVNAKLGGNVPAGYVIASLENSSERAAVLQAEGAYESALAARSITQVQAANTEESLEEAETSARNTYRTAYTTLDSLLTNEAQSFFSGTSISPVLNISGGSNASVRSEFSALRRDEMQAWRYALDTSSTKNPEALLAEAERITNRTSAFLVDLSRIAAPASSGATAIQKANLAAARADVDGLLATLSAERDALRAAQAAEAVAGHQTDSRSGEVASADASVKTALGGLRAAQAQLEKTVVRAPIGGQVNFLPIRVGDYVTAFTHVATVAQNGALEIVAYVGEDDRALLAAGTKVTVEDDIPGIVTSIAPALDPTTKLIEVHVAVDAASAGGIVNGQSVRIALPNQAPKKEEVGVPAGPALLPLSAVKLSGDKRIVFTVDAEGALIANEVEVFEVRGDRIEVRTNLPLELRIVTDARGLAAGQKVTIAP